MVLPQYTNTNLMITYLLKIELSIERIGKTPLPKSYLEDLKEELITSDIFNLSQLIDYPIGEDEARKVYLGKILPSSRSKHLIFNNYRNSLEYAKNYDRNNFVQPSSELILHINQITSNKVGESWDAGKMRSLSDKPLDVFDSWYKLRDYYPGLIFEEYFDEITRIFRENRNRIPFFTKMAILTYEMIDKAPLMVTNQITTLSLLSTLSKDAKVNPNQTIPFGKIFNFIKDDIGSAFKMSKSRRDITPFIEALLYSCSVHMVELENQYKDIFENKVKKHGALKDKFNKRQMKVLDYLEHSKKITRDEYAKMNGISFMTAYRDLQELLENEYVSKEGVGRGTYYSLIDKEIIQEDEKLEVFGNID